METIALCNTPNDEKDCSINNSSSRLISSTRRKSTGRFKPCGSCCTTCSSISSKTPGRISRSLRKKDNICSMFVMCVQSDLTLVLRELLLDGVVSPKEDIGAASDD
eukprot:CAMPEP_0172749720 /NCGR_PEP_ID=MMETSP1074-20121228/148022_1 /TAXON_ID=2916 /ORGANISM="Ceratium fusus, Strain PA161109" /LENGTH=105 /DNA_ID=CAMNT_0013581735 /DNA_START=63 /DNA_END=380 /DNA_ORIENTATION=+